MGHSQHNVNVVWLQTAELPLGERFAAEALEVSEQRSTRAKSSKSGVIYGACQQALTGVGGLALEHRQWMSEGQNRIRRQQYLPIVLTTANLLLMEYQTSGIDLSTGCLDSQTAKTTGIEWAILDVPVRDGLRVTTPDQSSYGGCGPSEDFRRRFNVKVRASNVFSRR